MRKSLQFLMIAIVTISLTACKQHDIFGDTSNEKTVQPKNISASPQYKNQHQASEAKIILLEKEEVKMVRAIESKEQLIVAVELVHWNTFQSKKLTKDMKKILEQKLNSKKKIEVTTDHKIFIELEKLEKKLHKENLSNKKLEKELTKILNLMNEQT